MESRINIGELDTLVTLQECAISTGDVAQKRYTFTEHSKVWAKLERNIDEMVLSDNLSARETIRATIYKIAALTTRWRVVVDGISYTITAIDPISRFSRLCTLTLQRL